MRQSVAGLAEVLSGSFTRRLYADVMHGSDRALSDVPLSGWSLSFDLDADVKASGSGTIVYQSVAGESLVPEGTEGVLSPFRASLTLVMEVSVGDVFSDRVNLGTFRVTSVVDGRDFRADVNGEPVVVASEVRVEFSSLDVNVQRRGFHFPQSPPAFGSCYGEMRRISGMPVEESVPDVVIPGGTVWEAKRGGRLDAVHALAGFLGGTAVVNSVGAFTVIPDDVGDPVLELRLGAKGTVVDVGYEIDTREVFNTVVGTFEAGDDKRTPIYSVARVTSGDLAASGDYGENTFYYSHDSVKTQAAADKAVRSVLSLSTGTQLYDVDVQCHINPLVEIGDVVRLTGWERDIVGRVREVRLSDSELMNVTIETSRTLR